MAGSIHLLMTQMHGIAAQSGQPSLTCVRHLRGNIEEAAEEALEVLALAGCNMLPLFRWRRCATLSLANFPRG